MQGLYGQAGAPTPELGARAGVSPGLPTPPCRARSAWPDGASLRGAAGEIGRGLHYGDKQAPGVNGSPAVDTCARPRGAARTSSGDPRQDSGHLQQQQARALRRVQRRGPRSLQQGDASRQRPLAHAADRCIRQAATAHPVPTPAPQTSPLCPGELVPTPVCSPALTDRVQSTSRAPRRHHAAPHALRSACRAPACMLALQIVSCLHTVVLCMHCIALLHLAMHALKPFLTFFLSRGKSTGRSDKLADA